MIVVWRRERGSERETDRQCTYIYMYVYGCMWRYSSRRSQFAVSSFCWLLSSKPFWRV